METNKLSPALLLIVFFLLPSIAIAHHLDHEFSLAISALRSHGYNLFPNAIAESHLLLLASRNSTLTFFSVPDLLLSSPWISLFGFVSPFRLPASSLQILSVGTCLKTLLSHHYLMIQRTKILLNGAILDSVTADGMRISLPDLYIGKTIAVHGLTFIPFGGFEFSNLPIVKLVTPYVSSWAETGLLRSMNGTNETEIKMFEKTVYCNMGKVAVWIRHE